MRALLVGYGLGLALFITACAAPTSLPTVTPTREGQITPYRSPTATQTATPLPPGTPTPLPSPTPTPRTYVIARGDELQIIARRFGITLDTLLTANPGIDPRMLKVGTALTIPASAPTPSGTLPAPTPAPAAVGQPNCITTPEGGLQCFVPVSNPQNQALENVSAIVRVGGANGAIISQPAASLLNILPAGARLALTAYFPPPAPTAYQASADLQAAIPVQAGDQRYLAARLENLRIDILPGGLLAELNSEIVLDAKNGTARQVWIAAAAFDSAGKVAGVRRWESNSPLNAGQRMPMIMRIYSLGQPIARVEAAVEARP